MLEAYNKVISDLTDGAYDFKSLSDAVLTDVIETTEVSKLIRSMVNELIVSRRYKSVFNQFRQERGATGKIVNRNYINPATGEVLELDGISKLLDFAPADVKTAIQKHTRQMSYTVDYSRVDLMKAFSDVKSLNAFVEGLYDSLYNGCEIDEEEEMTNIFTDLFNNGLMKVVEVSDNNASTLALAIKTQVGKFKKASTKNNIWKKLNPHDTAAKFWSLENDINIILPVSIKANMDLSFFATLFNLELARINERIFEVDDDVLPDDVCAIVFDSRLIDISADYERMEDLHYDPTTTRFKQVYNLVETIGVNPFANCVAIALDTPEVDPINVRNKTVKVASGVSEKVILDVTPLGANADLTAVPGLLTTTASVAYDDETGYILTVSATVDDTITFTVDGEAITGTITVDVIS